jgi:MFS transporter, PAT family, beta-lactamase induction signal transducer AmpG
LKISGFRCGKGHYTNIDNFSYFDGKPLPLIQSYRSAHPVIIGLLTLPYGIALGWVIYSLPATLVQNGFYLAPIMLVIAPAWFLSIGRILPAPFIDSTLSLRHWYLIGLTFAIGGMLPFFWLPPDQEMAQLMEFLIGVSQVGALLLLLTASGYMARSVPANKFGRAAGWYQAGILGGQGLVLICADALRNRVSEEIVFWAEILLMLTGMVACYWLPVIRPEAKRTEANRPEAKRTEANRPEAKRTEANRPEAKRTLQTTVQTTVKEALADGRSWFRSSRGIFITLAALSPIGVGAAGVGWSIGGQLYAIPMDEMKWVAGPLSIICAVAGFLVGGWAADQYGKWFIWFRAGGLLAVMALLIAFCPFIHWLFEAGILCYAFLSGSCTAAFWAIVVEAVSARLAITKITLLSMAIGVAAYYMRAFDGVVTDDYSFQIMLIAEALLSGIAIGIALLLRRKRNLAIHDV